MSDRPKLNNTGREAVAVALHLLKDFRQQILGVDWFDAVQGSEMLARALKCEKQFLEVVSEYPHIVMREKE